MNKLQKIICAAFCFVCVCVLINARISPLCGNEENIDAIKILNEAREKFKTVNDYTATFIKQQRIGGKLHDKEEMVMKFKKPFSVYYKWIKPDAGKEVIYVDGKNNNKLIGHLAPAFSSFGLNKFMISKWLSPTDPIALSNSKHPITKSGIGNAIEGLIQQYELAKRNGDLDAFDLGEETLDGIDTIVLARRLPKKKEYICYLSIVNIDKKTKLPIRILSIDWDLNVDELYYYKGLKLNQGLTDKDFDPNNPEYSFGLIKF